MNKRSSLLSVSFLLITVGLLISATRASTEGNCTPEGVNAGEWYQGCPNLEKHARWHLSWPDGVDSEITLHGFGKCRSGTVCCDITVRTTECWPLFHPPVEETNGKWSVTVTNKTANSTTTSCPGSCLTANVVSCATAGTFIFSDEHKCSSGGGSCYNGQDMPFCESPEHVDLEQCCCANSSGQCNSPILIDVAGDGFVLTNAQAGVSFDLNNDGAKEKLSWTAVNSDDAWLALDRNNNGTIDTGDELFGNHTPQPPSTTGKNGFLALAVFDRPINGGNEDGVIDKSDAVFSSLRLWADGNHNGISESTEIQPLTEAGLAVLELRYRTSRRTDENGNDFRYRAKIRDVRGAQLGRWAWDVFLVAAP